MKPLNSPEVLLEDTTTGSARHRVGATVGLDLRLGGVVLGRYQVV